MRDLNDLELQLLAHIIANPGYAVVARKTKKSRELASAGYVLMERGLVTTQRIWGGFLMAATDAGKAEVSSAATVRTISPLQLARQNRREKNGQYAQVDPCEVCGRRVIELWYSEKIGGAACDKCISEGKA
jgi:hypothetical protein